MDRLFDAGYMGEVLQELREDKNLTQDEIAQTLGVNRSTISLYETGRVPVPHDSLIKLANLFNVNLDYLFGRTRVRFCWDQLYDTLPTETGSIDLNKLFALLNSLSPHNREIILDVIDGLILKEKEQTKLE